MASVQFDFAKQIVVVTGGSRGIGYGVAEAFSSAGANVWLLADDEAVTDAARRLEDQTGHAVGAIICDITDRSAVAGAFAGLDRIDVLINNAGLERITPLLDDDPATLEMFARITDINIDGSFQITRAAVGKMTHGGRIVFTASIWSRTAVAEFSAYCASKHATLGLTRSLAHELGPRGVRVNAVCPGWVRTEASMLSLKNMAERSGRSEAELLDEIAGAQVFDGLMQPRDIAQTYLFLASDGATNITGQAFVVDRGEVMA